MATFHRAPIDWIVDENGDPVGYIGKHRALKGLDGAPLNTANPNALAALGARVDGAEKKTTVSTNSGGAIAFIFDDGYLNAKTIVAPMFEARGIRAGFAIPFTDVDGKDATKFMSIADCLDLQSAGHELGSHTYSNTSLTSNSVANETAKFEIKGGAELMAMAGLDARFFVAVSSTLHADFKQHLNGEFSHAYTVYKGGSIDADAVQSTVEYDPHGMHRTSLFTLWEATNATEGYRTIDRIKSTIDYVVQNGGLVVFYDHDPSRTYVADSLPETVLAEVLDYAVASGVDILTPSDAFDKFAPSTVKGQSVNILANRTRRVFAGADNLIANSGMTSYGTTTATPWYLDTTLIGTGGASLAPIGTGTTKPLVLSLDAAFTVGDKVTLRNRSFSVGADGSRIGAVCWSVWMQSGSSGRDTNWEIKVGINVLNQSTLAVLASSASGVCSLRDLFRRFDSVMASVPSYSVAVTVEVFIEFTSKASGSMSCRIKHPMLHSGVKPQAFKHGAQ